MAREKNAQIKMMEMILKDLSADDRKVRLDAIESLAMSAWEPDWNPETFLAAGGLKSMIEHLSDEEEIIRSGAASVIGAVAKKGGVRQVLSSDAIPILTRLLSDPSELVRSNAQEALQQIEESQSREPPSTTAIL
ncbi:MAG: HEAT repeat domain-containing protein [Methanomicrobiales archaeon]|nr:HEAT repeat domain-containing protein [Methanomicrobiales archaeon]